MLMGEGITQYISFIPKQIITWIGEHKLYTGLILFFGGNMLNGIITNSGALEIFYNGELLWSKLQSGKVPNMDGLVQLIKARGGHLHKY